MAHQHSPAFITPTPLRPYPAVSFQYKGRVSLLQNHTQDYYPKSHSRRSIIITTYASSNGTVACSSAVGMAPFSFSLDNETQMTIIFPLDKMKVLSESVNVLLQAFKNLEKARSEPTRNMKKEASLDLTLQIDAVNSWSITCNPNLFANAVSAKVFISWQSEVCKVSSQALLTQFINDARAFKAANNLK